MMLSALIITIIKICVLKSIYGKGNKEIIIDN